MFDLKRPCKDCPFKKGVGSRFRLPARRLAEIFDGPSFQCHKTLRYEEDEETGEEVSVGGPNPQQCAGLMAILIREKRPNQIMRVAMRLGALNHTQVDFDREAYDSQRQAITAHREGREPKNKRKT